MTRRRTLTFVAFVLLSIAAGAMGVRAQATPQNAQSAASACSNPRLPPAILNGTTPYQTGRKLATIALATPAHTLTLAVAATESDRELGLMCVTALVPQRGMIFVFPTASMYSFWMKHTLIRLDMVWLDAGGSVTNIAANVPASHLDTPDDAVARRSGVGQYVIELRAGEAAVDGLHVGTKLALPPLHAIE